jgi:hypothetical protein
MTDDSYKTLSVVSAVVIIIMIILLVILIVIFNEEPDITVFPRYSYANVIPLP